MIEFSSSYMSKQIVNSMLNTLIIDVVDDHRQHQIDIHLGTFAHAVMEFRLPEANLVPG